MNKVEETVECIDSHFVLSPIHPNIIYVYVDRMTKEKCEMYLEKLEIHLREKIGCNYIIELIPTRNMINKNEHLHYVLSIDHPNILYINIGRMLRQKAEEYLINMSEHFKKECGDYRIILIPYTGD
jgi:hypothetical protein